ncbi:MAG: hypothetical protein A3I01_00125 [Betaproteobacteria bacterium RIFCSPLOWO2_02_FULL_65_24]|nr:MAG: hypothetical protein A3I01_00125 [Betaproteobacteria bacterium RIFCSPLOWO2_02_FULL_65_24]
MESSRGKAGRQDDILRMNLGVAGGAAEEATGQMPAPPVREEVLRSEKGHPSEDIEQPPEETRRRTEGQPTGSSDRRGAPDPPHPGNGREMARDMDTSLE